MSKLVVKNEDVVIKPFVNSDVLMPKIAISCYTEKVTDSLVEKYHGVLLFKCSKTKIYKIKYQKEDIVVYTSPVGAPWAVMVLEDLISKGLEKIVFFGTCGILNDINEYEVMIPIKSRREEGTSYHYIEGGKYIDINPKFKDEFINILNQDKINYHLCKTWTTDAPYRETKEKVEKYIKYGISTVEMESSALATIGIYRNIDVFIFFYSADKLSGNNWNKRCLGINNIDKKLYFGELALKLILDISKK